METACSSLAPHPSLSKDQLARPSQAKAVEWRLGMRLAVEQMPAWIFSGLAYKFQNFRSVCSYIQLHMQCHLLQVIIVDNRCAWEKASMQLVDFCMGMRLYYDSSLQIPIPMRSELELK